MEAFEIARMFSEAAGLYHECHWTVALPEVARRSGRRCSGSELGWLIEKEVLGGRDRIVLAPKVFSGGSRFQVIHDNPSESSHADEAVQGLQGLILWDVQRGPVEASAGRCGRFAARRGPVAHRCAGTFLEPLKLR